MYELLNIKWGASVYGTESGIVTWSDDLSGLPAASGSNTGDLIDSLQSAFQAWEDVAALNFSEGGASADISIGYASFSTDGTSLNDGAAGTATWTPTSSGLNEPVDVRIEFNSDYSWSPFQDSDPSTINFFAVALHEIGHVIGLDHVDDVTEIMNPFVSATGLGDGDIAGAQAIYGLDEGDVPVEDETGGGKAGEAAAGDGGGGGAGGLILGLLALVFGLFTGGLGAAAVVAAGHVASDDDEDNSEQDGHAHEGEGPYEHFHALFLPTIPAEDFAQPIDAFEDEGEIFLL